MRISLFSGLSKHVVSDYKSVEQLMKIGNSCRYCHIYIYIYIGHLLFVLEFGASHKLFSLKKNFNPTLN